jgi:hypothetical protein
MNDARSLTHSGWECGRHAAWTPRRPAAQEVGYVKGRGAMATARRFIGGGGGPLPGEGILCVDGGPGRARIRRRILGREAEGKRLDQVDLFKDKRH